MGWEERELGVVLVWFLTIFLLLIHTKFFRICEQFGKLQSLMKAKTLLLVTFIANKNTFPPLIGDRNYDLNPRYTK